VNHFCTITTASHLFKVAALAESIQKQGGDFTLHTLVVDGSDMKGDAHCRYYTLSKVGKDEIAKRIIAKYGSNADKLRWCLKPVFLKFLIEQTASPVLYVDNDLFFYSDYGFIFDLLKQHSILLTPHYYKNNPNEGQNWLEANFRVGLYNAGFVGAGINSGKTLQWWAECCLYRCEKNSFRGLFDDQKYLDLIPVTDEHAHVLRHKGTNLASWNRELCERTSVNGELKIGGQYPVVCIHFNPYTLREIAEGRDPLLKPHYDLYVETLKNYKPGLNTVELSPAEPKLDKLKYFIWKLITDRGF
jgi:hypothetical protein